MPTGAESGRRFDAQVDQAGRAGDRVVRLADAEAADAERRETLPVLHQPVARRQRLGPEAERRPVARLGARGIDVDAPFDLATRERIERAVLDLLQDGSRAAAAA